MGASAAQAQRAAATQAERRSEDLMRACMGWSGEREVAVCIAHTVRRFYREVIEEPRIGGKRSAKRGRSAALAQLNSPTSMPAAAPQSAHAIPHAAAEQPRSRGP